MEEKLSREELVARLKEVAKDKTEFQPHIGAMCYEPMMPCMQEGECEHCGKKYEFFDYDSNGVWEFEMLRDIASLGYDVMLEYWCDECVAASNLRDGNDDLPNDYEPHGHNMVLFFRLNEQEPYHVSLLKDYRDLQVLKAFLFNKRSFTGSFDSKVPLRSKLDRIEKMIGIKID
ncbi:MAG: hypothetical protein J6X58_03825 [Bacteroidales bacterium]|nr:hypothetical protein [Bacteroidales bacterium]